MTTTSDHVLPELKQIVGSMLFVRKEPLGLAEIKRVLAQTAEQRGGMTIDYAKATDKQIQDALDELGRDLSERKAGFHLIEVAGGWRLENDAACGPWLRIMLQKGKGTRLSLAALETLAIVAYRQPCVRSEIEAVRGVAVDQILKNLLELGLVRVVGRSDLPGRPWMFGTTQKFMEHFGLKSLDELPGTDDLRRMEGEQARQRARGARAAAAAVGDGDSERPPENPNQMRIALVEEAVPPIPTPEEEAAAELSLEATADVVERDEISAEEILEEPDDNSTPQPFDEQDEEK